MGTINRVAVVGLAALAIGLQAGCAAVQVHSKPGTTTTVVLLRHADRDGDGESGLNARGQARAQALVAAVQDLGVTAIYSPNVERNVDTVKPLARHRGLGITLTPKVTLYAVKDIVREILDKHAGGVVVLVGNASGNLQSFYRQFGGTGTGPLEYGELYILTIPDQGPVRVRKSAF